MNDHSVNWFAKIFAKVPLRTLLIVPFVLQTVGVVTLVGYLSYRSGQEAVEKLSNQLLRAENERIDQHLNSYLGKAQEINRTNIVASSENESPAPLVNGKATRLPALNSREPVIREVTQDLIQRFGSLQAISNPQIIRPHLQQKPFVRVTPYRDDYGLNWLVVTVIPESEFMGKIHANARNTLILCGLALIIAMGTGSLTAYWIAKPILRLSRASQSMSKGEWQETLPEDITIAEIKVLARSFNQMSAQLKKVFQESETKFSTIFYTTPDPVWIATLAEGRFLNVNKSFSQFWGDTLENIVGKTCVQLGLWDNLEDLHYLKETLINEGIILNFKVVIRTHSRKTKTVLLSAKVQYLGKEDCLIGVMRDVTDLYDDLRLRKAAEDQLRESQYFIERITELTPNLLYIYDHIEERNVYMNRSVAEILGYSAAEVQEMGANLYPVICHPDDLDRVYEAIQKCHTLQDNEFIQIEYRVKDAQGQWRWLYSRDTVFSRTADGRVKQTLGTSHDITNRKEAELELRKSRDFREAIYNESTDAIFLVDVPNPLILDCNSRAVEMFEVASKEGLIGTDGQNLQKQRFTDDQVVMIREDVTHLGFWSQEVEYITKKGHNFWGNLAVKRINIAGKTVDLVRVTDISKRKEVELALLKSEKRFQEISASSPGVIYITVKRLDGSWYYEYMSYAFEDIHEITVEQIMVNPHLCFEQFHPDDCVGYEAAVAYSIETMSPFNYEWRIITPSGKVKWIKARSRPELRENGDIVFYGIVLDVSERKQVEEELQQTESKLRLVNQELEKLVNTDGLTQIANRRCFDNCLQKEWQRLYREQRPISLLLFDVDYFKLYNDSYGHQMGDECLIKIAQGVQQVVYRSMDLVARYGGEEFVVVLPNTDIKGAMAIAQRIHAAIKDLAIPHQTSKVSDIVTISLGITSQIPASESSVATLIEQADQALYRAKQQGRNQSVMFSV